MRFLEEREVSKIIQKVSEENITYQNEMKGIATSGCGGQVLLLPFRHLPKKEIPKYIQYT